MHNRYMQTSHPELHGNGQYPLDQISEILLYERSDSHMAHIKQRLHWFKYHSVDYVGNVIVHIRQISFVLI